MANIDLNRLRDVLRESERTGVVRPDQPNKQIFVQRDGKVRFGDEVGATERAELSEVPQHVFGGLADFLDGLFGGSTANADRLAHDREVVRRKLPWGTREVTLDGVPTFVYSISDEFGQRYQLALYFDGDEYQVKLVSPKLEGEFGVHTGHVFSDGRLCLRAPANGMPTLEGAYGRSVVLVNGLTVLRQRGTFPFAST